MEPYLYDGKYGSGRMTISRNSKEQKLAAVGVSGALPAYVAAEDLPEIIEKLYEACGLPSPVILEPSSARFPEDGAAFRFGDFGFRLYPEGVAPSLPGIVAKAVPPAALRELAAHLVALAGHAEAGPLATIRRAVTAMRADAERCGDKPGSFVPEVADWLGIEASALERKLPDDSGSVHVALRIARAYLGEEG